MGKIEEPESMEECRYFSRRVLENGDKLVLWVPKESPKIMNINYTCSKCKNEDSITDEYKLPYNFRCSKCDTKIVIKPLKGKKKGAKKKKKKRKKKSKK